MVHVFFCVACPLCKLSLVRQPSSRLVLRCWSGRLLAGYVGPRCKSSQLLQWMSGVCLHSLLLQGSCSWSAIGIGHPEMEADCDTRFVPACSRSPAWQHQQSACQCLHNVAYASLSRQLHTQKLLFFSNASLSIMQMTQHARQLGLCKLIIQVAHNRPDRQSLPCCSAAPRMVAKQARFCGLLQLCISMPCSVVTVLKLAEVQPA